MVDVKHVSLSVIVSTLSIVFSFPRTWATVHPSFIRALLVLVCISTHQNRFAAIVPRGETAFSPAKDSSAFGCQIGSGRGTHKLS